MRVVLVLLVGAAIAWPAVADAAVYRYRKRDGSYGYSDNLRTLTPSERDSAVIHGEALPRAVEVERGGPLREIMEDTAKTRDWERFVKELGVLAAVSLALFWLVRWLTRPGGVRLVFNTLVILGTIAAAISSFQGDLGDTLRRVSEGRSSITIHPEGSEGPARGGTR